MRNDFFIKLIVKKELSDQTLNMFYVKLQKCLPPGILTSNIFKTDNGDVNSKYKVSKTKKNNTLYYFPLTRHLTEKEKETFLVKMNLNNDMAKIVFSEEALSKDKDSWIKYTSDETLEDLDLIKQRKAHKEKVDEMLDDGWRFSFDYDKDEKTHPLLRPWSELPSAVHPKRYDFK